MSTAVAEQGVGRPSSALTGLSQLLTQYRTQIAMALPKHLTPERMIRIALTAYNKTPELQNCDLRTIAGAVIQASQLGLEPDGVLGLAYLIPYGKQCQLIVGFKGMMQLARNSGQIMTIDAQVVRAGDDFDYEMGIEPYVRHRRGPNYVKEKTTAVWAGALLRGGGKQITVLLREEVEQIRDKYSKAKKSGPWLDNFDEMAKKTAIRRLCKYLPMSVQMQTAIALDEQQEAGLPQTFSVDVPLELQSGSGDDSPATPQIEMPKRKAEAPAAIAGEEPKHLGSKFGVPVYSAKPSTETMEHGQRIYVRENNVEQLYFFDSQIKNDDGTEGAFIVPEE